MAREVLEKEYYGSKKIYQYLKEVGIPWWKRRILRKKIIAEVMFKIFPEALDEKYGGWRATRLDYLRPKDD